MNHSEINLKISLLLICLFMTTLQAGNCADDIRDVLDILFNGNFEAATNASHCFSPSGTTEADILSLMGEPNLVEHEKNGDSYFYYKTGAGPYWFVFRNNKRIKAGMLRPPRWPGTEEELAQLWERNRKLPCWHSYTLCQRIYE